MSGYVNVFEADNARSKAIRASDELVYQLEGWAEGRRGWTFHPDENDHYKSWASRVFDYPRHCQILLSLRLKYHGDPRWLPKKKDWLAELTPAFSAGPETSDQGYLESIQSWIDGMEAMLALPLKLGECKTSEHAQHMVGKTSARYIGLLGYLFDYDNVDQTAVRRQLVREFGPKETVR